MTRSVEDLFLGANALTGTEAISATSHKTTSEKEAEADLRKRTVQVERARMLETEFRAFADGARDYAFITLGLDTNVIGWNKGAEQAPLLHERKLAFGTVTAPRVLSPGEAAFERAVSVLSP